MASSNGSTFGFLFIATAFVIDKYCRSRTCRNERCQDFCVTGELTFIKNKSTDTLGDGEDTWNRIWFDAAPINSKGEVEWFKVKSNDFKLDEFIILLDYNTEYILKFNLIHCLNIYLFSKSILNYLSHICLFEVLFLKPQKTPKKSKLLSFYGIIFNICQDRLFVEGRERNFEVANCA